MIAAYVVVGGGISGLVAAYRLRIAAGPDATITVFDPADRLGGVLRTERIGGQPLDVGAEAFIARRPEVPALLAELGLAGRQIGTTGARPLIYSLRRLHPLPTDTLQGIPARPQALAGLVDGATMEGMLDDRTRPFSWRPGADPSVADLVGDRFGEQVVTRSVDPLLAGVYAGSAATIGLRSAAPTLAAALDRGARNLTDAVREAVAGVGPPPQSMFGAIDGGYTVLVDELVRRAGIRWAQVAVGRINRASRGWEVVDDEGERRLADAVVLAVPAPQLPSLIAGVAPPTPAPGRPQTLGNTAQVGRGRPRRRRDASQWHPRHWWRWRCRAAYRCPISQGCWWQPENRCAPRRSPCRAANGGGAATWSWCGCRTADTASPPKPTQPAAPATRICCRGPRRTWPRCSVSTSSRSIAMCTAGSTRWNT